MAWLPYVLVSLVLATLVVSGAIPLSGVAGASPAGSTRSASLGGGAENAHQVATVRGEPDLDVHLPWNTVVPGQSHELELVVTNDGAVDYGLAEDRNAVTKARNVRVTVEADDGDPISVDSGTQAVGSITEDTPKSTPVQITVAEDAAPGEYELDVEVEYSYTNQLSERSEVTSDKSATVTRTITLEIDDSARFAVLNASTTAPVGDAGILVLDVENVGERTAYDSRVTTVSGSAGVSLGESKSGEYFAGTWRPGEAKTVTYDLAVRDGADVRPYPLEVSVEYEDGDGIRTVDDGIAAGVTPLPEQSYTIEVVESDLRVGEDGEIVGEVTNVGPHPVQEVVIRFPDDRNIYPKESEFAVGSLDVDETERFRIPIEVGAEAEPVRRQFDVTVQYNNHDGDVRRTDDQSIRVDVLERRDEFVVEPVDPVIDAGDGGTVDFRIENDLDEPVENVHVKLFVDAPFSSDDDEAFLSRLEPGETARITFDLAVDEEAIAKTHRLALDVKYDDESGETELSDTYSVPIEVRERPDSGIGYAIPGVLLLGFVVLAGFWWRRRANSR